MKNYYVLHLYCDLLRFIFITRYSRRAYSRMPEHILFKYANLCRDYAQKTMAETPEAQSHSRIHYGLQKNCSEFTRDRNILLEILPL